MMYCETWFREEAVMGKDDRLRAGTRVTCWAVAAALVLLSGCGTAVDKTKAKGMQSCPVVYDETLKPQRLAAEDVTKILEVCRQAGPSGRAVWYVHVHNSNVCEGKPYWNVSVFFEPDGSSQRLRKGRCLRFRSTEIEQLPMAKLRTALRLKPYVQVSLESEPFAKSLEVPPPRLWPFACSEGFTDQEIIELVDFAPFSEGGGAQNHSSGWVRWDSIPVDVFQWATADPWHLER